MSTWTTEDRIEAEKISAYELADDVLDINKLVTRQTVASALRQQADRIAELELQLGIEEHLHKNLATKPQTKHEVTPLSDEEIEEIWMKRPANCAQDVLKFARAIETKVRGEK